MSTKFFKKPQKLKNCIYEYISSKEIKQVQQLLQQELDRLVSFKVRVIPANEFEALAELNG